MPTAIRTTHTGSLPRPSELVELLIERDNGEVLDAARFDALVTSAVDDVVKRQRDIGLSVVNDGEMSKMTYATYLRYRVSGFAVVPRPPLATRPADALKYPMWWEQARKGWLEIPYVALECRGPLTIADATPLETDLRNLRAAAVKAGATDLFMTAASPGIIADYIPNTYYKNHEEYLAALVGVQRPEYEAIVDAGFMLQLDCPDLSAPAADGESDAERDARKMLAIEAINAATARIDPQRMRMHLCWGNAEAPHESDLPLGAVLPLALKARPGTVLFEGGNPRHEHEWTYFRDHAIPEDKIIAPGIIDNTTTFIEHPELVAQRIERYTQYLGNDRVMAGVDCGFGTWAVLKFDPAIAFAKMRSLVEGAAIASARS
jgi:5-methyltetrahydropteroyltriglutamate--homocysteine methyltransferase